MAKGNAFFYSVYTMAEAPTIWLRYLEDLRPHLRGRDHRGKKGSLRWLEALGA